MMTLIVAMYVIGIWMCIVAVWLLNAYPDCIRTSDYGEDQ